MSQQPMFHQPSGPKPRVYKWNRLWTADVRPGDVESFRCSFHNSQAEALQQAVRYATEAQQ